MAPPPIDTNMSNTSFVPRHAHSRTESISSDRPSTIGFNMMSPPLVVTPEAAFIAASAASQIVTNDHDSHAETWYDQVGIDPSGETALVANGALQLANNFIDQLLFNIIAVARSTSLAALRPAVSEVLKPKLAKDAINQADEELREYLGGGEVEDLVQTPAAVSSPRDWDLELVWKRTRLRCMVYSSLGDMEEEDEDYYMEQEDLNGGPGDWMSDAVSPAVAIFLTSILEFMGEQVLVIAGQAAFNRLRVKYEKELKEGTRSPGDVSERIVVEELDMERVALDRTLGRLWRSWKKRIRSPIEPSRPFFARSVNHSRQGSICTDTVLEQPVSQEAGSISEEHDTKADVQTSDETQEARPSAIPLPMSNNDIAEIEVPGLVSYSDDEVSDEEEEEETIIERTRPKSLMILPSATKNDPPTPNLSQPHTPVQTSRKRANSLPTPAASPYTSPKPSHAESDLAGSVEDHVTPEVRAEAAAMSEAGRVPTPEPSPVKQDASRESTLEIGSEVKTEDKSAIAPIISPRSVPTVLEAMGERPTPVAESAVVGHSSSLQPEEKVIMDDMSVKNDEIEDFTEEPEILTSSRVSLGGRSSPGVSESGRPISIMPQRSSSVRSVRVIDVPGRSPSLRSRRGSDTPDHMSASRSNISLSREGSISTPPIVEEGDAEAHFARALRKQALITPSPPISREPSPVLALSASGSARRSPVPTSAPTSKPAHPGPTKVTILSTSTSFLDLDTKPEPEQKAEVHRPEPLHKPAAYPRQPPLPTLPEKSTSRYTQSTSSPVDRMPPASRASPEPNKLVRAAPSDSPTSLSSLKFKPVRTSDDGSSHRAQDVAKNFEELLNNDQTIQYTLTPENMRDFDSGRSVQNGSPVLPSKARRSEDTKNVLERTPSAPVKRSLSVHKATGLNSHPPEFQSQSNGKLSGPVPRAPPVSYLNQTRSAGGAQARDARVGRESINDFAEFIRTTGPPGDRMGPGPSAIKSPTHRRDVSAPVTSTTAGSLYRRSSANRMRLQAREPVINNTSSENSDLIDFIRRGPPSSGNNPRIPRNVAPFRSTMDSDIMQMSGAVGGKAVDAVIPDVRYSQASTNFTDTSVQSSTNSQSALLSKANKPAQYTNNFDDDDMIPKRKQRRVRDPYAIDFSDEEEDDFDVMPKPKPKTNEESLIDFLNNYQPPPDPTPPQPFITSKSMPKKKASAPNLMARLRSGGGGGGGGGGSSMGVDSRSLSSRASNGRGYTPIVANIPQGADTYGTTMPNNTHRVSSSNRVLMKKFEPREASTSTSRTSDLAMFLRDSEPPPGMAPMGPPPIEQKSSGGFSRMFERRKKSIY